VVRVRFDDPDNLTSFQNFLEHALPGTTERDGDVLEVTLRAVLAFAAERTVVERLLWAWHQDHGKSGDGFIAEAEEPAADGNS
jgi:hypothetical protein